ncbi:MAG: anchored repeat ABC transporter, substrate-binding protein [Actinomycetaceae bacterium]|nr:anchored repeat ABC transporter, substrate-binding protein [Actinomycetaceae bacterium]
MREVKGKSCRKGLARSFASWALALVVFTGLVALIPLSTGSANVTSPQVVATTPILADLAQNVAGDRLKVESLVKSGADPHTYEPSLGDVRKIANARLALTNYLYLEEQALIRAVDNTVRPGTPVAKVGEESDRFGGRALPLIEDASLNTIWLGLRSLAPVGDGTTHFELVSAEGPGRMSAYLTTTFGTAQKYFDSDGGGVDLPQGAHTHVSWSFQKAGVYKLHLVGSSSQGQRAETTVTIVVGKDPHKVAGKRQILNGGHADIAVGPQGFKVLHDQGRESRTYDVDHVVFEVPGAALQQVPADPSFRFLGRPGEEVYLLPQGVIGKHVHGDTDPHMWLDVENAIAYVQVIRDRLAEIDPEGAATYTENANQYMGRLRNLHAQVKAEIAAIPKERRHLVTTHDGYQYLARAYGLNVAGFVTSSANAEPSARDLIALTKTLENLQVRAVFVEPNASHHAADLKQAAGRLGIKICTLWADSFTDEAPTYERLMLKNAHNLKTCLGTEK